MIADEPAWKASHSHPFDSGVGDRFVTVKLQAPPQFRFDRVAIPVPERPWEDLVPVPVNQRVVLSQAGKIRRSAMGSEIARRGAQDLSLADDLFRLQGAACAGGVIANREIKAFANQ